MSSWAINQASLMLHEVEALRFTLAMQAEICGFGKFEA